MSQSHQLNPVAPVDDDPDMLRRPFILGADEPLLMPAVITDIPARFITFCQSTGLSAQDVVASTTCSMPLPAYRSGDNPRQWGASLKPEMLWHPLLWLPASVTNARTLTDPVTGQQRFETDDELCARLALEVMASNVYEAQTGTWVDVLALYDLDSQDPETVERLGSWLAGEADAVLDSIDLSELFVMPGNEQWASELVEAMSPALLHSRFALLASDVLEILDEFANPDSFDDSQLPIVAEAVSTVFTVAALELPEMPADLIGELSGVEIATTDDLEQVFTQAARQAAEWDSGGIGELMDTVATPAASVASAIKDRFTPDFVQVDAWLTGREELSPAKDSGELATVTGADG